MYNKKTADSVTQQGNKTLSESIEFLERIGKSLDDMGNTVDKINIPEFKHYNTSNVNPNMSISTTVVMRGRWNIFKRLIKGIFTGCVTFTIQKRTK